MKSAKPNVTKLLAKLIDKVDLLTLEQTNTRTAIQIERYDNQKYKFKTGEMQETLNKLSEQMTTVLNNQDALFGMFQRHQEEIEIQASGHRKALEMSDRVEKLEKIHPSGLHA